MSIKVMAEVWESSSAKGGARLVLLALADHANDEGYCHPSVARLALKSALTERNVLLEPEPWARWLRDLDEREIRVTTGRLEEHVKRLHELHTLGELQAAIVARAIAGGWSNLYPPRASSDSSKFKVQAVSLATQPGNTISQIEHGSRLWLE